MWFNKNLQELLDSGAKLSSGNTLFLTDLQNVLYVTTGHTEDKKNNSKPMSKELQQVLNGYKISIKEHDPIVLNNQCISIYEEIKLNTIWKSLMIFPIIINDKVYGSIISASYHKVFDDKHIKYARTTIQFVTQNIIDFLNNKMASNGTVDPLNLFYDINLEYVASLLDEKKYLLDDVEIFKKSKDNYSTLYEYFNSILSEEDMKKFERLLHYKHIQQEYENTLCLFMGMKINNNISKL